MFQKAWLIIVQSALSALVACWLWNSFSYVTITEHPYNKTGVINREHEDVPSGEAANSTGTPLDTKENIATSTTNTHRTDVCFVTVQMGVNGEFLEPLQNLTDLGIRMSHVDYETSSSSHTKPNVRYIVFTNDDRLEAQDWEKVVLSFDHSTTHGNATKPKYHRVKTLVTYGKFIAGWRETTMNSCRVVFVTDALNVFVPLPHVWLDFEHRLREQTKSGFLGQRKADNRTVLDLLDMLPGMKKDTREHVELTKRWLNARADFDKTTVSLWTNFFGFLPDSEWYRHHSWEFWKAYSTEELTPRDQPLFSYFLSRTREPLAYVNDVEPNPTELRPNVHICYERDRLWCAESGGNHSATDEVKRACRKTKTTRNQHRLVFDYRKARCDKKKNGHKFSGLVTLPA